jgi:hypothetical protein
MLQMLPCWTFFFAPTKGTQLDALLGPIQWRGRVSMSLLIPTVRDEDPLPDPYPNPDREQPLPERQPELPTPTDVPAPGFTDVPVPEPWDVPPPTPGDPRPRSVP